MKNLSFTSLFVLVIMGTSFCQIIKGFHDYKIGDSLFFIVKKVEQSQTSNDTILKYVTKSKRTYIVDSIITKGDSTRYVVAYHEKGTIVYFKSGNAYDTVPVNSNEVGVYLTYKGKRIKYQHNEFFPKKASYSENELWDTVTTRYGNLYYNGSLRDYVRFYYWSGGPGGATNIVSFCYLSGFGTVYWDRLCSHATTNMVNDLTMQLIRYNDIVINPDDLDTLLLPTAIEPKQKQIKINSIRSMHELHSIVNAKKSTYSIAFYSLNGRIVQTKISNNEINTLLKLIPSGVYIIKGKVNDIPFSFRQVFTH